MDSMLLHSKSTKSSKRPEVHEKFVNLQRQMADDDEYTGPAGEKGEGGRVMKKGGESKKNELASEKGGPGVAKPLASRRGISL